MTASPVLAQVEGILRPQFSALRGKGNIPPDTPFQIAHIPVKGTKKRRYFLVDKDGKEIPGLPSLEFEPTISD